VTAGGNPAGTGNEARVREQSHKSEMRAALRGDFERLAARRGAGSGPVAEVFEPIPADGEPELVDPAGETLAEPVPAAVEPQRPSWRDRLRGAR